jgi:hypothetical protein
MTSPFDDFWGWGVCATTRIASIAVTIVAASIRFDFEVILFIASLSFEGCRLTSRFLTPRVPGVSA